MNKEWFLKLTDHDVLEELYFDGNELNCNCQLQLFTSWAMENKQMRNLFQAMNNNIPRCDSPASLKGKEIYTVTSKTLLTNGMKECTEPTDINAWSAPDGEYLALHCRAEAEPLPTYQWFKGSCDQDDNSVDVVSNEEIIYLKRKEDEGEYKCVASNFKGNIKTCINAQLPKPQTPISNIEKYEEDFSQEETNNEETVVIPDDIFKDNYPDMKQYDGGHIAGDDDDNSCDKLTDDCYCQRRYGKLWVDCRQQELRNFNFIKGNSCSNRDQGPAPWPKWQRRQNQAYALAS